MTNLTQIALTPSPSPTGEGSIEGNIKQKTLIPLDVSGMKCAGCVKVVESELTKFPGVNSATVNLITSLAVVECESTNINPQSLADVLTNIGFPSQIRSENSDLNNFTENKEDTEFKQMNQQLIIAAFLLILSLSGHVGISFLTNIWFHWSLATLTLLFPGREIIKDGWIGIKRHNPNMNTLVGLGTISAYVASCIALIFPQLGWECFFDEPVMLLGFILLGRNLEYQAKKRAKSSFTSLLSLQPKLARLIINPKDLFGDKNSIEIAANQLKVGELIRILPGEKIPADGEIISGESTINQSMLTGESLPVYKSVGDVISAGTINQSGVIVIRVNRAGKHTTLAQIISFVENAQTRKAPIQKLADIVAGYFTYGVLTISFLTFLFWQFIGTKIWHHVLNIGVEHLHHTEHQSPLLLSLKLAITVLVIACPCALGLATPTAILVGTSIGAEKGLLIKGGDILEKVNQIDTIVFDKTGTLTTGNPIVTDIISWSNLSKDEILKLAYTVEMGTRHPLAEAIKQEVNRLELTGYSASNFQTFPGEGVTAIIEGKKVMLGNLKWLEKLGIEILSKQEILTEDKTVIYVSVERELVGAIAVKDILKPDAKIVIESLEKMGFKVMLLTGDKYQTAANMGEKLGIKAENILAEILPTEKAKVIEKLQEKGHKIAMVGDGINDAPALAQADVGIAVYNGTDVAIESAGIVLMRPGLNSIIDVIKLSQQTLIKIRQNLFWAFAYNIIGIPIAAGILLPFGGILLNPATAGALMAFSSISVVTNSINNK